MKINYKTQKIIASIIIFIIVIGSIFFIKNIKSIQDLKNLNTSSEVERVVDLQVLPSAFAEATADTPTEMNLNNDSDFDQVSPLTPPKLGGESDKMEEQNLVETQDLAFQKVSACNTTNFGDGFICLLNEYRVSQGKSVVTKSSGLMGVAQKHTDWMEENNKLSHLGNNNFTFTQRCQATGITCAAENVGYGFLSAQHLLELWQNSPTHNENLLGDYTRVGVGFTDKYATLLLDF